MSSHKRVNPSKKTLAKLSDYTALAAENLKSVIEQYTDAKITVAAYAHHNNRRVSLLFKLEPEKYDREFAIMSPLAYDINMAIRRTMQDIDTITQAEISDKMPDYSVELIGTDYKKA